MESYLSYFIIVERLYSFSFLGKYVCWWWEWVEGEKGNCYFGDDKVKKPIYFDMFYGRITMENWKEENKSLMMAEDIG